MVVAEAASRTRTGKLSVSNLLTMTNQGFERLVSLDLRKLILISEFFVVAFTFITFVFSVL